MMCQRSLSAICCALAIVVDILRFLAGVDPACFRGPRTPVPRGHQRLAARPKNQCRGDDACRPGLRLAVGHGPVRADNGKPKAYVPLRALSGLSLRIIAAPRG